MKTTPSGLEKRFGREERCRMVLEAGTHSPWVSRLLEQCGHEVVVANPRKVESIAGNENKEDWVDAELLAWLGRVDVALLHPIHIPHFAIEKTTARWAHRGYENPPNSKASTFRCYMT